MEHTVSAKAARYIAHAHGDMRVARAATYGDMTEEHLLHYRYTLRMLQEAQDLTGVVMIPGAEIADSVKWCDRMMEKIAA